ncbi:NAD-dependent epimerase/dehydratase family protein [Neptuniibacter sp. QD37_11]|uniref:NAD-dependent epimerase/dehydratase family protein n=1 Tax=Neptuniibacter sp. QD37_11 TaxID=3398209 RepID=UPI0039F4551D
MRVLVTGAAGFLGAELSRRLATNSSVDLYPMTHSPGGRVYCDLLDQDAVNLVFKQVTPDIVVHCAAEVPKREADYLSETVIDRNTSMVKVLINTVNCPVIFISSMAVYDDALSMPCSENQAGGDLSAYGTSKLQCEALLTEAGVSGVALRLPGLYGSDRKAGLVHNLLYALKHQRELSLPDKPVMWSAMDVMDAANVIEQFVMLKYSESFVPVNVGYAEKMSVNRLVNLAADMYATNISYEVIHKDFEFILEKMAEFGVVLKSSFAQSLEVLNDRV